MKLRRLLMPWCWVVGHNFNDEKHPKWILCSRCRSYNAFVRQINKDFPDVSKQKESPNE